PTPMYAPVLSLSEPHPCHPSSIFTIRRPPPPPLFPYTTLFRSHVALTATGTDLRDDREDDVLRRRARLELAVHVDRHRLERLERDRKSTRLNSSHVKISYAVFCLKKKNYPNRSRAPQKSHVHEY